MIRFSSTSDLLDQMVQVIAGDGGIAADHRRPGFVDAVERLVGDRSGRPAVMRGEQRGTPVAGADDADDELQNGIIELHRRHPPTSARLLAHPAGGPAIVVPILVDLTVDLLARRLQRVA